MSNRNVSSHCLGVINVLSELLNIITQNIPINARNHKKFELGNKNVAISPIFVVKQFLWMQYIWDCLFYIDNSTGDDYDKA